MRLRLEDNLEPPLWKTSGQQMGQFCHAAFGVAIGHIVSLAHGAAQQDHKEGRRSVGQIAKRPPGTAIAFHHDRPPLDYVSDKIGEDTPVVQSHSGAVGMGNSNDFRGHAKLVCPTRTHGFAQPLAFRVTAANFQRIDQSIISLADDRPRPRLLTVDLPRTEEEKTFGPAGPRQGQQMVCPEYVGGQRSYGIGTVEFRTRLAGGMNNENLRDLESAKAR